MTVLTKLIFDVRKKRGTHLPKVVLVTFFASLTLLAQLANINFSVINIYFSNEKTLS